MDECRGASIWLHIVLSCCLKCQWTESCHNGRTFHTGYQASRSGICQFKFYLCGKACYTTWPACSIYSHANHLVCLFFSLYCVMPNHFGSTIQHVNMINSICVWLVYTLYFPTVSCLLHEQRKNHCKKRAAVRTSCTVNVVLTWVPQELKIGSVCTDIQTDGAYWHMSTASNQYYIWVSQYHTITSTWFVKFLCVSQAATGSSAKPLQCNGSLDYIPTNSCPLKLLTMQQIWSLVHGWIYLNVFGE